MKSIPLALSISLAAVTISAQQVAAYEVGDLIVRAGIATVAPDESSSELAIPALGGDIAGSAASVDDNTQLGITGTYMLNSHWGLGLLAATPFSHDVSAKTGALGLGSVDAATVKHLPPTLTLQFFPLAADSAFQPYIGAGINYTVFFDESVDSELESVLGSGKLDLDDSWGLALEAGVDIALSDKWLLNAALWYLDIDTDAKFKFDSGVSVATKVDIDPWVYALTLGYKF
ncbi:MAG: membrane protein [Gammaproteobacteria bacterium BRH_c0]|nr:MAG: membrane protein [Gammaproteobacteria bacterium BRH_c0]